MKTKLCFYYSRKNFLQPSTWYSFPQTHGIVVTFGYMIARTTGCCVDTAVWEVTAMGSSKGTPAAPPLPGTTHIMQFTASNIFFRFHSLCCTLPLIANQCDCPWIRSLQFLLFLGSPPAHQFWSSLFYMPLIQRKNSLVNALLLSVPPPIQALTVYFQGTTQLHTSPVDHVQAKRALSQNPSCQSALSFSISHVTEMPYERALVHLPQSRAAQAQTLCTYTYSPLWYLLMSHSLAPPLPTPLLGAAIAKSLSLCRWHVLSCQGRGETKVLLQWTGWQ